MMIWPISEVNTFLDTRLAVGRFRAKKGQAPVYPTITYVLSTLNSYPLVILTVHGDGKDQKQINVQKLKIAQVAAKCI